MIAVTASEKEAIQKKYPTVQFVRTMVNRSKRHRYYMVEASGPMRMLRSIRSQGTVYTHKG